MHDGKLSAAAEASHGGGGQSPAPRAREVVVVVAPRGTRTYRCVLVLKEMGYEVVTIPSLSEPGVLGKLGARLTFMDCTERSMASLQEARRQCRSAGVPLICLVDAAQRSGLFDLARTGVDDFVVKSASPDELKARVLLRIPASGPAQPATVWPFADRRIGERRKQRAARLIVLTGLAVDSFLTIDLGARRVLLDGRPLPLTPKEFNLLALLASAPGRVFSDSEIVERVWTGSPNATSADVAQYVHRLRRKLGDDSRRPQWLMNIKRFGYKLNSTFSTASQPMTQNKTDPSKSD